MVRTILHCDLNNFFASVEILAKPELKDVPMAVCGDAENRRGIILAKNQIAKGYGVVTAETIWQAQRKCPDLVLVPPHREKYTKYSKIVFQIYERYTDMVESFGIDEAWLDVTGSLNLFGSGKGIADDIRTIIKEEVGLTVSVGVSFNKIFAKLGSDYKKPDATTVITKADFKEIVYPLPVSELLYVGKKATTALVKLDIKTIGDLALSDRSIISSKLGKTGEMIHDYANGLDYSPVQFAHKKREMKSVGRGSTFNHNLIGVEEIKKEMLPLAENVAARLRCYGLKCTTVQITIRDPKFKTITRQRKLQKPTCITSEIINVAIEILEQSWNMDKPIRMLTITGSNLVSKEGSGQISFFDIEEDEENKKAEKIEYLVDDIRRKYGSSSISLGANIHKSPSVDGDKSQ